MLALTVCIAAAAETRTTTFNNKFNELNVSSGVKVIYIPTSSGTTTVKVSGSAKRVDNVEINGSSRTLKIRSKKGYNNNLTGVTVTVTMPMVNEIDITSGASVTCSRSLNISGKFDIEVTSGASANFGNITCREFDAEATSAGTINVAMVRATKADVEATSAATITIGTVNATNLDCEATSSATINLRAGNVTNGDLEASSAATINARGLSIKTVHTDKSSGAKITLR